MLATSPCGEESNIDLCRAKIQRLDFHESTFYNYGTRHQECLAHILRALKDSMDNEPDRKWNRKMRRLVQEMIHYRNGLSRMRSRMQAGLPNMRSVTGRCLPQQKTNMTTFLQVIITEKDITCTVICPTICCSSMLIGCRQRITPRSDLRAYKRKLFEQVSNVFG